jgi:hypothetical protein
MLSSGPTILHHLDKENPSFINNNTSTKKLGGLGINNKLSGLHINDNNITTPVAKQQQRRALGDVINTTGKSKTSIFLLNSFYFIHSKFYFLSFFSK